MSDIFVQAMIYMCATFILGGVLGWAIWGYGSAKQLSTMASEVNFWKENCEQSRFQRDNELRKIELLEDERKQLKQKLAAARG